MTHHTQRLSSGGGRDSVEGATIQLFIFELIKEKLNKNDNETEYLLRKVRMRPASWRSISTMPFKGIRGDLVNPGAYGFGDGG